MPKKVLNWLRKKIEPVLGEGLLKTVEFLNSKGVDPSIVQSLTNKTLQYAPEVAKKLAGFARDQSVPLVNHIVGRAMDLAPKKVVEMYAPAILDAIPSVINPTFDSYPSASSPASSGVVYRSRIPQIPPSTSNPMPQPMGVVNSYRKKKKPVKKVTKKRRAKKVI